MAMDSPLAAATEILRAADARDWAAVSALVHPDEAERLQRSEAENYRRDEVSMLQPGALKFLYRDSVGPRDGPTYMEAIYGVSTAADLSRLPARAVVERLLRVVHWDALAAGPREALGEVREGADTAHVVFRRPDT